MLVESPFHHVEEVCEYSCGFNAGCSLTAEEKIVKFLNCIFIDAFVERNLSFLFVQSVY